MTFVLARGLHAPPGAWLVLRRENYAAIPARTLARYPKVLRDRTEGEEATERAGNGQARLSLARTAESDEMKGGCGGRQ